MKTEPIEARDMLYKFAEMRGWNKNKLIGWSETADFADWFANQSSPKIKQLEWENHGYSITAVGISDYEYCINLKDDHTTLSLRNNYQIIVLGTYSRPDEAKAAAQADFEKRVKECLE